MSELQSDDFYVPSFLLSLPPKAESDGHNLEQQVDDFLKNVEGWSECYPTDDWITDEGTKN